MTDQRTTENNIPGEDLAEFIKTNVALLTLALLRLTPLPTDDAPDAPIVSPTTYDPLILRELEAHHMIELSSDGSKATLTPLGDQIGDMLAAAAIEAIDGLLSEGAEAAQGAEADEPAEPAGEDEPNSEGVSAGEDEDDLDSF